MYAWRLLNPDELEAVGGGLSLVPPKGDTVTFYDNDRDGVLSSGDTIIHYTTADGTNYTPEGYSQLLAAEAANQDTYYWSAGYALGIGFGLEYNAEGFDINWTAGLGAWGEIGVADTADVSVEETTGEEDEVVIGELVVPTPDGEITEDHVEVSAQFGVVVIDSNEPAPEPHQIP